MINSNLCGLIFIILYYVIAAGAISLFDYLNNYKREWIRKGYHLLYSFSLFIYLYMFKNWYISILMLLIITIIAIIVLKFAELSPSIMKLSISRKDTLNEVIIQMIYIHSTFIVFILFFNFFLKLPPYHALLGTVIWGFGDAAAAVSGKYFGKNNYQTIFSAHKTREGTIGFIIIAFIPAFLILFFSTSYSLLILLLITGVLVLTAAFIEAITRHGLDTITIPLVTAFLSVLLQKLF